MDHTVSEWMLAPHSVIEVRNFGTMIQLTEYLHMLNSNDTAYGEYLRFKRLEGLLINCYCTNWNNRPSLTLPWQQYTQEAVKSGVFSAYSNILLENDGPVTIDLESPIQPTPKERKAPGSSKQKIKVSSTQPPADTVSPDSVTPTGSQETIKDTHLEANLISEATDDNPTSDKVWFQVQESKPIALSVFQCQRCDIVISRIN